MIEVHTQTKPLAGSSDPQCVNFALGHVGNSWKIHVWKPNYLKIVMWTKCIFGSWLYKDTMLATGTKDLSLKAFDIPDKDRKMAGLVPFGWPTRVREELPSKDI